MTTRSRNHTADLLPPFRFTPDSKAIVIGPEDHGHIWRVSVPDGDETMIPFTAADVDQELIAGGIKASSPRRLDVTVQPDRDRQVSPETVASCSRHSTACG